VSRHVAWALALALCASVAGAKPVVRPSLVSATSRPARDPAAAAVLIGGINDSWQRLSGWVPLHAAAGRRVLGFAYDQKRTDLATNAQTLEVELLGLRREGVRRLHITAFSMGGWIAKAALDRMAADGTIAEFETIELVALATPWGGFERANVAWKLRFFPTPGLARRLSQALELPMGFEVGSATPFVRDRRAPLPANVAFYVCEGDADEIATPRTRQEHENYEAVVALARRRIRIPGANHRDMSVPRLLDLGRGRTGLAASF
jgi:alpha-beta hydrolase superfamily lysophospholipase